MDIEALGSLIRTIDATYASDSVIYVKNVSGDPVLANELPAFDDHIATVYPIDCLSPNSISDIKANTLSYINNRPIVILCKGTGMFDWSVPVEFYNEPPYTGRPFIHQKWDCFTVLRDFYKRELNIEMPPVTYFDEWWNKGEDFYMTNSGVAGFYPVTNLKKYDVIAMRLFSHVFNHSAIYLGDNKILHHVGGKFSCIEEIRPAYVKMMFGYFRHKDLVNNG